MDYVRRLVSGNKARHKDNELDVELDLSYITEKVIVMGYPTTTVIGGYDHQRRLGKDTNKILEHHHGQNFWVFNFCPTTENSYPDSVFKGRVSRYPFLDHLAPPLAMLPLFARAMHLWLDGPQDHVAALCCKAGKGRSGTMACAYLLTLAITPSAPGLAGNLTEKEKAKALAKAEEMMDAMPLDEAVAEDMGTTEQEGEDLVKLELADSRIGNDTDAAPPESNAVPRQNHNRNQDQTNTAPTKKDTTSSLSHLLDLHTSRRMKRSFSPSAKLKPGVSIPSHRRWLYYWSLVLAHQAPPQFWAMDPDAPAKLLRRVRLTQIQVRMRKLSGLKANLVRAANALLSNVAKEIDVKSARGASQVWASLARYDDESVDTLEQRERITRDENGEMGVRSPCHHDDEYWIDSMINGGTWDTKIRNFARMGMLQDEDIRKEETTIKDGKVETLLLCPLTGDKWNTIRNKIEADGKAPSFKEVEDMYDVTLPLKTDGAVVLNAHREVRVKLYLGQVFMGRFWFIPTFHMLDNPRGSAQQGTTFVLTRKQLDFPVGIGAHIIDVAVSMEWGSDAEMAKGKTQNEFFGFGTYNVARGCDGVED